MSNLSSVSTSDLWKEIYYRDFKSQALNRDVELSDEDARSWAEDAHANNDDEEEELLRRNEEFFDNLEEESNDDSDS